MEPHKSKTLEFFLHESQESLLDLVTTLKRAIRKWKTSTYKTVFWSNFHANVTVCDLQVLKESCSHVVGL